MLICILTKNVITSCSVTMMLFLHLEVKPLMTLTTVLYLSCALISGHLAMMLIDRKSGSAGMPRPTSYAVFCLKKKNTGMLSVEASREEMIATTKHGLYCANFGGSQV